MSATEAAPAGPKGSSRRWWLGPLLKLVLTALVFSWLLGKFSPETVGEGLSKALVSPWMALTLAVGAVHITLSGLRWGILLRSEEVQVPAATILKLTWIGHFWNMVIPGAVSGDAVKMFYVGQVDPARREEAWTTVFSDRAIGLAGLVTVATLAALANLDEVLAREPLARIFTAMLVLLGSFAVAWVVVALGVGRRWAIVQGLLARLPVRAVLARAYASLNRTGRRWRHVLAAFVLSCLSHGLSVTNVYLLGLAAGEARLDLGHYCLAVPVTMFVNAVPLLPGGNIGVGEAVLGQLFEWSGGRFGDGFTVMLLYRAMFFALAAVGALLYVLHGRPGESPAPAAPPLE